MPGIETFPMNEPSLPTVITEETLMGAYHKAAVARTASYQARHEEADRHNAISEFVASYHETANRAGLTPSEYYQQLGQMTDEVMTANREHISDLILAEMRADAAAHEARNQARGRKLRVVSLVEGPDASQPITLLRKDRLLPGERIEMGRIGEAVGIVTGRPYSPSEPRLELRPKHPRRLGYKKIDRFLVRMVDPAGEPLVDINFLD